MKNLLGLLLFSILLLGCGNRKTNKTKVDTVNTLERTIESVEETKTEGEVMTYGQILLFKNQNNNILEEIQEIEPIDQTKPIVKTEELKDGKIITTFQNSKVRLSKKIDTSILTSTESSENTTIDKKKVAIKKKAAIKEKEKIKIKKSVKDTENTVWYSWTFFLLIILLIIWLFRKKLPFIKNFFA